MSRLLSFQSLTAPPLRYGRAVFVVVLAFGLSLLLVPISDDFVFLLLTGAVALGAWRAGVGVGVLGAVLAILLISFLHIDPATALASPEILIKYGFLLAFGALIGWLEQGRNLAESALADQCSELAAILDSVADGVTAQDASGAVVFANRAAAKLTGYPSPDAMLATPVSTLQRKFEMVDDRGQPLSYDAMPRHAVFKNGTSESLRFQMRFADTGEEHWIRLTSAPLFDAQGNVKLAVNAFRDITERMNIEQDLARYAALVQDSADGIISKSLDGTITGWNPGAEQIYGYRADEAIGRNISMLYAPALTEQERHLPDRLRHGEKIVQYETRRLRKDGQKIDISLTISPIRNATGEITGLAAIERDITERNHLLRQIERERRRLDSIIRNLPGIIFDVTIDPKAGTQTVNFISEYTQTMLGYSPTEWKTDPNFWQKIVNAEDLEAAFTEVKEAFENERMGAVQFRCTHANGEIVHAESFFSFAVEGANVRQYGVIMDISERKESEQAIQQYTNELRRSNEELEQFAYVASHDLQEPLRMVTSYLQLIEQRYADRLDDNGREFINYAVDGSTRMKTLIGDLLAYSRVQRTEVEFSSVDVQAVLNQVCYNLQIQIEDTQATITHDELPTITANERQMVQLFQNLIGNAIKFHGTESPRIHISAQRQGIFWRFAIKDNGIGIDPAYQDRVFVIFQRLHPIDAYAGTGIGLAICRKIVDKHNGKIWFESQPDAGTTFYFTLPLTQRKKLAKYARN